MILHLRPAKYTLFACFSFHVVVIYKNMLNHKNSNFLNCDWFKKLLFPTNSLAKFLSDSLLSNSLLSESLLSDSSTNQSYSKL